MQQPRDQQHQCPQQPRRYKSTAKAQPSPAIYPKPPPGVFLPPPLFVLFEKSYPRAVYVEACSFLDKKAKGKGPLNGKNGINGNPSSLNYLQVLISHCQGSAQLFINTIMACDAAKPSSLPPPKKVEVWRFCN